MMHKMVDMKKTITPKTGRRILIEMSKTGEVLVEPPPQYAKYLERFNKECRGATLDRFDINLDKGDFLLGCHKVLLTIEYEPGKLKAAELTRTYEEPRTHTIYAIPGKDPHQAMQNGKNGYRFNCNETEFNMEELRSIATKNPFFKISIGKGIKEDRIDAYFGELERLLYLAFRLEPGEYNVRYDFEYPRTTVIRTPGATLVF